MNSVVRTMKKQATDRIAQLTIGNIAYQQSGRLPKRNSKITGLWPTAGWSASNRYIVCRES